MVVMAQIPRHVQDILASRDSLQTTLAKLDNYARVDHRHSRRGVYIGLIFSMFREIISGYAGSSLLSLFRQRKRDLLSLNRS